MHVKTYLSKILKNHCWECGTKEKDKVIKPIHPDSIKELEIITGSTSEAESNQLEAEEGFSYHDNGYVVAKLSKLSASPACCHYKEIKQKEHITDQKFIDPKKADQL
eukprot:12387755-Ditylum_brightwellii.AAC.1